MNATQVRLRLTRLESARTSAGAALEAAQQENRDMRDAYRNLALQIEYLAAQQPHARADEQAAVATALAAAREQLAAIQTEWYDAQRRQNCARAKHNNVAGIAARAGRVAQLLGIQGGAL